KTDVKIRKNRPEIFILDKKKNNIILIEVGITSQDSLQIVETEKLRKYDLLANELGLIYKCSVEIISYVMTWDGIVTKYHKSHIKRLEIPMNVEAYIQSIEDDAKNFKPKNKAPFISQGGTTLEEPTNNINKESDLEEETKLVKEVEENIKKWYKNILTQNFIK
ncbi:hypothetical protein CWI36_2892p0010, partial [Hamiltosporidium magnivora]